MVVSWPNVLTLYLQIHHSRLAGDGKLHFWLINIRTKCCKCRDNSGIHRLHRTLNTHYSALLFRDLLYN